MKRKKPYYVVVDLLEPMKTEIERSASQIAIKIGMHRNSIDLDRDHVYGHYLVLPRFIN